MIKNISQKLLIGLTLCISSYANSDYAIVVPPGNPQILAVAKSIIDSDNKGRGFIVTPAELSRRSKDAELILTLGANSTQLVHEDRAYEKTPKIAAFIPRNTFLHKHNSLYIYNDVNLSLQLRFISELYSGANVRVGLFYSHLSSYIDEEIENLSKEYSNIDLYVRKVSLGDKPVKLMSSFVQGNKIDAFIIIPDSFLYDPHSLSVILYQLYQLKVSSITYNSSLVENGIGSLASTYFTKKNVIDEIISQLEGFRATGTIYAGDVTPSRAKVALNEKMVRYSYLNAAKRLYTGMEFSEYE